MNLLIPKNSSFTEHLADSMTNYADAKKTETALRSLPQNVTTKAIINEQSEKNDFQIGYILGQIKAWYDTLPEAIAKTQKIEDIPVNLLVKLNELVLSNLDSYHKNITGYKDYWKRYRSLSEYICGFGYNMSFIPERYHRYFPKGTHHIVEGFANGYSTGFHTLCEETGISTDAKTHPIEQDIWKNWQFFVDPGYHEYRLDGKYLFMYHGGYNCTPDRSIPYGNNVRILNVGVYQKLQNRTYDSDTTIQCNIF